MPFFERSQVSELTLRLSERPSRLIALSGPRQTGKTTMVRQALRKIAQSSTYVSVDEPDSSMFPTPPRMLGTTTVPLPQTRNADWIVSRWEEARFLAQQSPQGHVLVLDEIQKIANWSGTIKGLWDADRVQEHPLHVVVLGSAPLLMQSGLSESLAGRFEPLHVTHWSFPEMSVAFGFELDQYIYFGGYPGSAPLVNNEKRWRDYVLGGLIEPNIERDIVAMTPVNKPALLKQLFELGSAYSGQILSYNKMLGQLQDAGNTTTLARYLGLLSTAGLLTGLSQYSNRPHLRRGSSPKLNVLNTALMTAGSGYSFAEAKADRTFWGRLVESAVGAHLFNTATQGTGLFYWRDSPHEVDFVLRRGPNLVSIEVKSNSAYPKASGLSGLIEFQKRFSPRASLLVGEGGIPVSEFLSATAIDWVDTT